MDRSLYYNRRGEPISEFEHATSRDERSVARTVLPNGTVVSTVWIGIDDAQEGPPLIFETKVFGDDTSYQRLDVDRYSTEAEAKAGHARLVEKWLGDPRGVPDV